MTDEVKMRLIEQHREEFGLRACLAALGVPKSTWFARQQAFSEEERDAVVVDAIREVIRDHPAYGWRRIQVELREQHALVVNHKRLKRILRGRALGLPRHVAAKRRAGPAAILPLHEGSLNLVRGQDWGPLQALSTDFTELIYRGHRKAWLMAVVDLDSRYVAGWGVAASRNRELALHVLDKVAATYKRLGQSVQDVIIHHEKDSVYTS